MLDLLAGFLIGALAIGGYFLLRLRRSNATQISIPKLGIGSLSKLSALSTGIRESLRVEGRVAEVESLVQEQNRRIQMLEQHLARQLRAQLRKQGEAAGFDRADDALRKAVDGAAENTRGKIRII